jgi:hypothetical protein
MIASEQGINSAAPTPCTARARISVSTVGAIPQPIDAIEKMVMPIMKIRRLPIWSAAAPPMSKSADIHNV